MRVAKQKTRVVAEADLTPMIDMTFQLIAFFMVLINFSQVEQSEAIMLPSSMLAKPPQEAPDFQILLNLRATEANADAGVDSENERTGRYVIFAGRDYSLGLLKPVLQREVADAARRKIKPAEIVVIIRAHRDAPMRRVQALISLCQENDVGLETFSLRVKERR